MHHGLLKRGERNIYRLSHPALLNIIYRRFPVISGIRVSWDSRKDPGNRVLGVWLTEDTDDEPPSSGRHVSANGGLVDVEPIKREKGGRLYKVVTREYLAAGKCCLVSRFL